MTWEGLKKIVMLITAANVMIACVTNRMWTRSDSWYREEPRSLTQAGERIDERYYLPVMPDRQSHAQAMLMESGILSLTTEEAATFVGAKLKPHPGLEFYLVRGVYLNQETGGFFLSVKGSALLVHHSCLGRPPVAMKRMAIVVQLSRAPTDIYVTCSMDE